MSCVYCDGYWVCGPLETDPCGLVTTLADWKGAGCISVPQAGNYTVWCKPGCKATIQPASQPDLPSQWTRVGYAFLAEGDWAISCQKVKNSADKCEVKLALVDDCSTKRWVKKPKKAKSAKKAPTKAKRKRKATKAKS